jgi:PhoH-like ATPase
MKKFFVLDTNVLLHNADSIESFSDNIVILPIGVIEELDSFKSRSDELGRNARKVIRRLDDLRKFGHLGQGVPMENGGTLKIILQDDTSIDKGLHSKIKDNEILRAAYSLFKEGNKVIFISKDINARIKADALGMEAKDYEKQRVNFDELFSGYRNIEVPSKIIDDFFQNKNGPTAMPGFDFYPNEFIMLVDEANEKHTALSRATDKSEIIHLQSNFDAIWNIKARNREQRMAFELLMDPNIQIVTLIGQAGTGKTLLALAAALETTLKQNKYDKILVSRPIIPLGKDIGYLPGDKVEKMVHWMQPIFDNMTFLLKARAKNTDEEKAVKKEIEKLQKENLVELEALTYIRGRSIPKQYVIVDEAQNLTPHEVKTIVSRAGEGTKMVLTGDPYQIDSPYLDASSNGLTYTVERLKGEKIHGHITLRKSERSRLAGIAADLL